ncbi:acyl-CoA dehydrogenase family protein [Mycobacterium sp. HUMS_1102779]|uniref:acyl-CoA dehydrogenase family protein n=1 Tax=Mycobacterium sp. HUMS_1102779 TaxID=3383487 RepID=UPI00389A3607
MSAVQTSGFDTATREEIAASLRELFEKRTGAQDIAPLLAELGWAEVLAEDPATAVTLLFTEHGRALASSRALDDVMLAELSEVLPTGRRRAVIYPHPPEGSVALRCDEPIVGLSLGSLTDVDEAVLAATLPGGAVGLIALTAADLRVSAEPLGGFDFDSGWRIVTAVVAKDVEAVCAAAQWDRAVAAGRRALAAEILGVCDTALNLVASHAAARVQFGRPIGSFQAVRHRLSEAYVAMVGARAVLDNAYTVAGSNAEVWAALIAKIRAGHAQAVLMRHAVQVFGAIGLTRESDIHRYVERAAALDALLGGHQALTEVVGSAFLDGDEVDAAFEML